MPLALRDYSFLGVTQSLCPQCLAIVPTQIIARGKRVYFKKRCATHGEREDFICSDRSWFDRNEYAVPGKIPEKIGTQISRGCPDDCGLCPDHQQHTCLGLIEITTSCNLRCPMCYASSGPGGEHLPFDECKKAIDRLVEVEGRPEVIQLSGGEPTIHPDFEKIVEYAWNQPVDMVMINTNGLRFATEPALIDFVAKFPNRLELYFQFDGFEERCSEPLRGARIVETKLRALEQLEKAGVRVTLVTTLQAGVNTDQIGRIVQFAAARRYISGVSFQPATYIGRYVLPEELENRVTFPDVIKAIEGQTNGLLRESDFLPLPCAHPNCHIITYAYRTENGLISLPQIFNIDEQIGLLANGISYTRARAKELVTSYLSSGCAESGCSSPEAYLASLAARIPPQAHQFLSRALAQDLSPSDVFRIAITSFLDAYNFDVQRVMKCCIHHVLPEGNVVPFCTYSLLYRHGPKALPKVGTFSTDALAPANSGSAGSPLVTLRKK